MLPHADRWMQPAGVMYALAAFCTHVDVLWDAHRLADNRC
jgi:hypothetical protein